MWSFLQMAIVPHVLLAQSPITGNVKDRRTGESLPGVSIAIKGTTTGTATAADGSFTLRFPQNKTEVTLIVRFLGYTGQELPITQDATSKPLLIALEEDRLRLDEVVVTGQGMNISKRRLSTDVVSIGEKELKDVPASRIDQLLQAKLPNAQIKLTGGQAGASSIVRSRGVTSAFNNSTPIIYVDGVRMDNLNTRAAIGGGSSQGAAISAMADIPMDNIERIEFINGGAATTLYGSDAANGVIQIITKKGGSEKTELTLDTQMGVETSTNDYLFFDRTKELLFQNGFYQKHNIGLSGGQGGFGYSFSGGYTKSTGVQISDNNSNERIDLRTGFRAGLGDKLTYESSFSFINNSYKRNRNGNQGGYTALWFAESGASAITGPQFNPDINAQSPEEFEQMKSYVAEAERLQNNKISVNRFQTSQTFRYNPLENLVFKATGGVDYRVQNDKVVQTNQYLSHTGGKPVDNQGSIVNYDRRFFGLTLELNGQHEFKVNQFSFVTTVGGQLFRNEDQQVAYRGENIRDGALTISGAAVRTSDEFILDVVNYGIYVQENIGFKDKVFLDLGVRGDGNSAFGKNIGTQYYPKIGFSYIPSAEPYFDNIASIVSSAKVRGNYGIAGNFPTPFANDRTIAFTGFLGEQSASFGQPGNKDLKPERVATFETGIDLGFVGNRIILSGGYYYSTTSDALFMVPPAPSTGESNQLRNIGEIRNKGFEFKATVIPIETSDFTLSATASLNTLDNKVVSSGGAAPFNINGFSARTIQTVVQEGYPIGFLRGNYGYFNAEGVLEETEAQQYLGTTIPNLFGILGVNLRYKKLAFFANADYQKGAYASSFDRQFRFNYGASNEGIPQAEIDANKRTNWLNFTNMFVEKTDFLKVRTIGLNYTLKPQLWHGAVKNLAIGFTVVNPLNFAASSFDPETTISGSAQGQGGATTGGISYATYSAPRQFLTSLRLNF
ncbi:TonB-dependent receptor domain-containing protein [Pontibacter sp. 13R65]|uniref:TonB-dependent receptor domain-containing protein n=1 Tax=Pontibacter sp. 13R65 TaxID=3127458 RepID=UPI00301D3065